MSKGSHMVRWHNDTIPRWRHESYGRQQGATHGTRQDAAHDTRHFGSSTTGSRVAANQPFPASHLAPNLPSLNLWDQGFNVRTEDGSDGILCSFVILELWNKH